jgi:transposase
VRYVAPLVNLRFNPAIRACYEQIEAAGKPKKVALVACMRKLLLTLDAIARDKTLGYGDFGPVRICFGKHLGVQDDF